MKTTGRVLHAPTSYDILAWFFMLGREAAFREKVLELAAVRSGDVVLDIACGTGTLAIAAARRVGPTGMVTGVDASPEMIARATKKAGKAQADVDFRNAIVEALPFADASFDVVLSTLMLHHLPRNARAECVREVRRVLQPRGKLLIVDFGAPQNRRSLLAHFHRHGHIDIRDVIELLRTAGLNVIGSGDVGIRSLQYVLSMKNES